MRNKAEPTPAQRALLDQKIALVKEKLLKAKARLRKAQEDIKKNRALRALQEQKAAAAAEASDDEAEAAEDGAQANDAASTAATTIALPAPPPPAPKELVRRLIFDMFSYPTSLVSQWDANWVNPTLHSSYGVKEAKNYRSHRRRNQGWGLVQQIDGPNGEWTKVLIQKDAKEGNFITKFRLYSA